MLQAVDVVAAGVAVNKQLIPWDIKITIPDMELKTEHRCIVIDKGYICIDVNGDVMSCYQLENNYNE